MEETIQFLIQLGELFEIVEQQEGIDKQEKIYSVAKMYLEEKNISTNQLLQIVDNETHQEKFNNLNDMISLLTYIEWKDSIK